MKLISGNAGKAYICQMIKSIKATFLAVFISGVSLAQSFDTARVMTYNLLYYGQVTSFCPSNVNVINDKDEYLKTIAHFELVYNLEGFRFCFLRCDWHFVSLEYFHLSTLMENILFSSQWILAWFHFVWKE